MAMQVERMRVIGSVMECQPITRALFEHELLVVRIRLAVHREAVEFTRSARYFFKYHVQLFYRCRLGRSLPEDGVIPTELRRRGPLRRAALIRVFDHNAQAALADRILGSAHDPDP